MCIALIRHYSLKGLNRQNIYNTTLTQYFQENRNMRKKENHERKSDVFLCSSLDEALCVNAEKASIECACLSDN